MKLYEETMSRISSCFGIWYIEGSQERIASVSDHQENNKYY